MDLSLVSIQARAGILSVRRAGCTLLRCNRAGCNLFATSLNEGMSLRTVSIGSNDRGRSHLQGILSGESLAAIFTIERLDRIMDLLVSLQVVVSVEARQTFLAFERTVIMCTRYAMSWRRRVSTMHLLNAGNVATVKSRDHRRLHAAHHGHLVIWAMDIRHNRSAHRWNGIRWIRLSGVVEMR